MCGISKPNSILIGFPIEIVSRRASSSMLFSTRSANFNIHSERWAPVNFPHGPDNALRAAVTAALISFSPAIWTLDVTTESSYGLWTVNLSGKLDSTYFRNDKHFNLYSTILGSCSYLIIYEKSSLHLGSHLDRSTMAWGGRILVGGCSNSTKEKSTLVV